MRRTFNGTMTVGALGAAALIALVSVSLAQQDERPSRPVRAADGKPNFSGIWQALNEAHWDLQAHEARPGALTQPGIYPYAYARVPAAPVLALGSAGGVPASLGVVEGDGRDSLPSGCGGDQEGERGALDRPRS